MIAPYQSNRFSRRPFFCTGAMAPAIVALLLFLHTAAAFVPFSSSFLLPLSSASSHKSSSVVVLSARHSLRHPPEDDSRRRSLATIVASGFAMMTAASGRPSPALASSSNSDLLKPNPLTNSVLEQMRIWEQESADNLKYGGTLAAGDAGNKGQTSAYPRLLVPILQTAYQLETINRAVQRREGYPTAMAVLQERQYETKEFKKTFNAFADNIYYSDPDRANLYLGGGATPKTEQSLAYLLRNEILTAVQDMQAELTYLTNHPDEVDDSEIKALAATANRAMQEYLAVVPPNELKQAKELLQQPQP